jgi:hypothetical protein
VATDRKGLPAVLTLGGGVVLAIAVFLPFYAVTFTASGVAMAQQNLNSVAQQFGNSAFQSTANSVGSQFGSLVGKQLGTASSHQVMKYISVVLLVLAGIAILVTMVRLTGTTTQSAPRGTLALIGFAATLCIVFRMLVRPSTDGVFAITLSWGAWLALASSIAIIVGDLLPGGATQVHPQASAAGPLSPAPPLSPPPLTPAPPPYPGGVPHAGGTGGTGTAGGPSGLTTPPRPPGWA